MRTSLTSGLTFLMSIIIIVLTLTVLLTVGEQLEKGKNKWPEKRINHALEYTLEKRTQRKIGMRKGCAYYGYACMGGHGKRFDPDSKPQEKNNILSDQQSEEFEKFLPKDELFVVLRSDDKSQQELNQPIMQTRQNTQQYDPYNSSPYFLKRWMRRSHRRDLAVTDYK